MDNKFVSLLHRLGHPKDARELARELAAKDAEIARLRAMLKQTAQHQHGYALARLTERHSEGTFDKCTNGWCMEAAAALQERVA